MRQYEKTHPWITFQIDLRDVPYTLWMKLGECTSKIEHISRVPLVHDSAEDLYKVYLAKGVHATTAIEGNTLTEDDVLRHLDGELDLPPSREYLAQEVDNIVKAINATIEGMREGSVEPLDIEWITEINRAVLDKLNQQEGSIPGTIRTHSVGVGGRYRGAPAEDCEYLADKLCHWLRDEFKVPEGEEITFAIIKAVLAHLYVAWIHPFGDGNGRTARLLELAILLQAGIPVPACHLLSSHYSATRAEYARQLARTSQSGGEIVPFLYYAVQGFLDGLNGQLEMIWKQHLDIVWRHHVYQHFPKQDTVDGKRRRDLLLELSKSDQAVSALALILSAESLGPLYEDNPSNMTKDLQWLVDKHWIRCEGNSYVANKETMLNLRPFRVPSSGR
ncbi:MAG: Fic family protein [Gemmatimonadota bacterium]|nr:Fic family protein [Gemmatimonadota bacterium]